ncbi:hypothetical protein [Lentilactobacillus hilgardii]|uniref:hypothetical protein n=1 Tax=Lentilactobacillus hilgardii TaxID=1588 RepID=UPI0021A52FAC|nr:hypothetical protein [Lentilactobacillus hilgardii]MCT3400724.1 hypothetical protein [Lentilactobacillus hilgardii]
MKKGTELLSSSQFFWFVLGLVLGSIFPVYLLLLKDPGWFGALGDWVAALGTLSAVYVSLKLAENKRKVKLEVEVSVDISKKIFLLRVINTGFVPIHNIYVSFESGIVYYPGFEVNRTINVFEKRTISVSAKKLSGDKKAEIEDFLKSYNGTPKQKANLARRIQVSDAWDALIKDKDVQVVIDVGKNIYTIPRGKIHYNVLYI